MIYFILFVLIIGLIYYEYRIRKYELEIKLLQKENYKNGLTGVFNRKYLELYLRKLIQDKIPASLIFFDIDKFKLINDKYGHNMGDKVLAKVAESVSQSIRGSDLIIRWGGDEFLIVLPNVKIDFAVKITERLLKVIKTIKIKGLEEEITISVGVTKLIKRDMIKKLDKLLYRAKQLGGGKVCVEE